MVTIYPIEVFLLIVAIIILGLLGMEMTVVAWIIAVIVVISTLLCWIGTIGTFAFASESKASEMVGGIIMSILMSHMSYHLVRLLLTNSQVHGIDLLRGLLWLFWPV